MESKENYDYRQELLKEERKKIFMGAVSKGVLFFGSALLLQVAWYLSFEPVFKLKPLNYMEALGFVLFVRVLIGFPEFGRGAQRRWEMRLHLKSQALMQRTMMDIKQAIKEENNNLE
jgi:hypothetical protein